MFHKLSRLFVWGFEGPKVSASLRSHWRKYPPAGVILFKRNLENPRQIQALTRELKGSLIGIDEEGGRVSRLPPPFLPYPPAATWGRIYRRDKGTKTIFQAGCELARELISLGINTDFAPVLDVNSNPKNPIIGDRAFSEDPKIAAKAAVAFFQGMKRGGLIACGKHFPGHGDTRSDSHLVLPRVKKSRAGLERVEFHPFREAIRAGIPMLMTAHVVYPALDPKNPATLSRKILQDLLRKKMRFKGVVISDDLNMKAISKKYSPVEAAVRSLEAGVDLILICRGGEEGEEIVEKVAKIVAKDRRLKDRINESFSRISTLKKKYL